MEKAEELDLTEILAANRDLEHRLAKSPVSVAYDEEFDIFLLAIGEPRRAITEEIRDGLQLRLDPTSLKIVGIEVVGFARRYLKVHPEFRRHFESLFGQSPMQSRDIPQQGRQRRQAQEAARELIPA